LLDGAPEWLEGILMAKRTIHMLVDDIDGGEADETVRFAVDGVAYEIDLSEKNATKMRDALARYVAAGSKVSRNGGGQARPAAAPRARGSAAVDRDQNRAIREWAQAKGIGVSDRGRIKQEIVDRYHAEAGR
jgi:Lsr2